MDKTRFLHELEEERFAFLIRPRRFGKSCWVSLLEHYYDRNRADRFETPFGGTDIGRNPTPNRSRYVILRFDFSAVNDALETLEREFEIYCGLLEMYREHGALDQDVDTALDLMREWYDGYRFATGAEASVYNTDMVLYYLKESLPNEPVPDDMIDSNVRIDYGKLRHLLVVNRQLNRNFDLLRQIIGEETADGPVQSGFPLDRLDQRENFVSCSIASVC